MKNCIIIHGCADDEHDNVLVNVPRIERVQAELQARGIQTYVPAMPQSWQPNYKKYNEIFEQYEINEQTVLIGHSCGCAFLVRWLGDKDIKVKKLVLVAPRKIPYRADGTDKDFYLHPIDTSVRQKVDEITIFTSDDEEEDGKKSVKIFQEALHGRIIELPEKGHYTLDDIGEEFPELLDVIYS